MDSLFFSSKKILKLKKNWEKIGLWIPLFEFFFQIRNLKLFKKTSFLKYLKRFFSQISKFKLQKRLGEDRIMDSLIMPLFDFVIK